MSVTLKLRIGLPLLSITRPPSETCAAVGMSSSLVKVHSICWPSAATIATLRPLRSTDVLAVPPAVSTHEIESSLQPWTDASVTTMGLLEELGCTLVGPAMRLDQADTMLNEAARADVAILDVNIGGRPVFPFAEKLVDKGVPLVFATGYGRDGLPPEWQGGAVLGKPYTFDDVASALMRAKGIA